MQLRDSPAGTLQHRCTHCGCFRSWVTVLAEAMDAEAAATDLSLRRIRRLHSIGFLVFRRQGCLEEAHDVDCNVCQSVAAQTR